MLQVSVSTEAKRVVGPRANFSMASLVQQAIGNSNEVRVLHGHVVALFDEAVVCVDVAARSDDCLRSCWLIDTCRRLWPEPLLACIEHNCVFEMFVPWLVHGLRSALFRSSFSLLIETWAWDLKLEALPVEHLIVVKTRRSCVETDPFASDGLVVTRSLTVLTPHIRLLNASNLILDTEDGILIVDVLTLLTLRYNLGLLASFSSNDANSRVLRGVRQVKAVRRRSEDCIAHCSLLR